MPDVPQVRMLAFNNEEIGMGFNSTTGLAVGTCLEGFQIEDGGLGQEVVSSIDFVESHDQLMTTIGFSFEAQGRYGFFSGGAKAAFSETTNFNSVSTFLVVRVIVKNPLRRGKGFRVIDDPAGRLLTAERLPEFNGAFGDSFVRGLQTGGEFYAVIRITSVSKDVEAKLAASAHAEASGLVASGSFNAALQQANNSESSRSEFIAMMYQNSGEGASSEPTANIEDVLARFKKFTEIANDRPAAYETEVASYATIPLPVPTATEQEEFLFALRDARNHQLDFIERRNDIDLALRHAELFVNLEPLASLREYSSSYTKLIGAVIDHAVRLSRGEFNPPKLFDPSSLIPPISVPTPLVLERKPNSCPTIAGVYTRSDGGRVIQFVQSGLSITCVDIDPSYDHRGTGQWNGAFFDYTVVRKNLLSGCVTQMFAKVSVPDQNSLKLDIVGTDGNCDLPKTFVEGTEWRRT